MRAALLTTDTTHHAYWAWRLREQVEIAAILIEPDRVRPPFETAHPFEQERDAYEREVLLADLDGGLRDLAPSHDVANVNDADALTALAAADADLVVSFGTGLLGTELIRSVRGPLVNLHGGNPEEYRGLDTHLWAVYHGDFENLVTTLHVVDAELDTGAIVGQAQLRFETGAGLHQLRAVNTEACVELTLAAALALERLGRVPQRDQIRRGRYYSFMPAVLKQRCVERFEKWTSSA